MVARMRSIRGIYPEGVEDSFPPPRWTGVATGVDQAAGRAAAVGVAVGVGVAAGVPTGVAGILAFSVYSGDRAVNPLRVRQKIRSGI